MPKGWKGDEHHDPTLLPAHEFGSRQRLLGINTTLVWLLSQTKGCTNSAGFLLPTRKVLHSNRTRLAILLSLLAMLAPEIYPTPSL